VIACALAWLAGWWPVVGVAVGLVLYGRVVCARRLGRVGPVAPSGQTLAELLHEGRYEGVVVREEPAGPYGGGRWVPGVGEIRLSQGMLARRDVDALMILAHERTHAARDWPAPRWYRLGLVLLFLVALALGLNGRVDGWSAGLVMVGAYLVPLVHVLRNEWVASAGALRLTRGWPAGARAAARARLVAAYGVYLGDWALVGLVVLVGLAVLSCR
jgi:hypothetical protein